MSVLVASSMKTSRVSDHTSELEKAQSAFGELHTVHNFSLELAFVNFLEKMKALGPELETKLGKNPFPDDEACIDYLAGNKELTDKLEAQMPNWRVATVTYLIIETISLNFDHYFDPASKETPR